MSRSHRKQSFLSNSPAHTFILPDVKPACWILEGCKSLKALLGLAFVLMLMLAYGLQARADDPASKDSKAPVVANEPSGLVDRNSASTPIVIGFVGGFIRRDDAVHSTVIVAHNLQRDYAGSVHIKTFENRRVGDARNTVLRFLAGDHRSEPTADEKRAARVILYGHSWGASAALALARQLQARGVPVLLTVQVDSVAKLGQDDALVPGNVEQAANFYQINGFPRGQRQIRAADSSRTKILGNFRFDYDAKPLACQGYPWIARTFMKSHIEIECDPAVWHRVEELIREQLPPIARETASQ
jgi:pimeloyl-ACP methyl ester carboxylesterase